MKWFFIIVIIAVAGWKAAVWWVNRTGPAPAAASNLALAQPTAVKDSAVRKDSVANQDSIKTGFREKDTIPKNPLPLPKGTVSTKGVQPQQVVDYAKTLMGVPYLYGSTDPAKGFDCSGFITHVFNRFNIAVPRSSIDFTAVGTEVSAAEAKGGDLILFTGTDSSERFVGHMGIVVSNSDTLRFIHSTSGKQYGVTVTPLNKYYQGRYVKTVRVFP